MVLSACCPLCLFGKIPAFTLFLLRKIIETRISPFSSKWKWINKTPIKPMEAETHQQLFKYI